MHRLQAILATWLVSIAMLCAPAAWAANERPSERAAADALVRWINDERSARGLGTLRRDTGIDEVAGTWSDGMATHNAFVHRTDLGGVLALGYTSAGENIAMLDGAGRDAVDVHRYWMDSGPHRRNLLRAEFTAVGVGVRCIVRQGDLQVYAVANFGGTGTTTERDPVPPPGPVAADKPGLQIAGCGLLPDATPAGAVAAGSPAPVPEVTQVPATAVPQLIVTLPSAEPQAAADPGGGAPVAIALGATALMGGLALLTRRR